MVPPIVEAQYSPLPATWKFASPSIPGFGGTMSIRPRDPSTATLISTPLLDFRLIPAVFTGPFEPARSTYLKPGPLSDQPLAGMWKHWVTASSLRLSVAPPMVGFPTKMPWPRGKLALYVTRRDSGVVRLFTTRRSSGDVCVVGRGTLFDLSA